MSFSAQPTNPNRAPGQQNRPGQAGQSAPTPPGASDNFGGMPGGNLGGMPGGNFGAGGVPVGPGFDRPGAPPGLGPSVGPSQGNLPGKVAGGGPGGARSGPTGGRPGLGGNTGGDFDNGGFAGMPAGKFPGGVGPSRPGANIDLGQLGDFSPPKPPDLLGYPGPVLNPGAELGKNAPSDAFPTDSTAPFFVLPKITQGLSAFNNVENNTTSRGRINLDPNVDIDKILREASITPRRPEIIAKIPLFQMRDIVGISQLHELRQFEKQISLESLDGDWSKINSLAKQDVINNIVEAFSAANVEDEKVLSFLSDLRDTMDLVIDLLDIKKNSRKLSIAAKNFAQELIDFRENDFNNYPSSIESFIEDVCGVKSSNYFSNTKIVHTVIREFSNSLLRHYPMLLSSNREIDKKSFAYPKYAPEGPNSHEMNVREIGNRNIQQINANGTQRGLRLSVTESYLNVLPGISRITDHQDRIKVLSTLLHNELIISSGMGRLLGTSLGNIAGVSGVDPIEKILGGFYKNNSSVLLGNSAPSSFADMIVINENFQGDSTKILPFERAIVQGADGKAYLPGSSYFIETPIRQGNITTPLDSYSKNISTINTNLQNSFKILLNLDQENNVTPDSIVIRCIRSIRNVLSVMASYPDAGTFPTAISAPVACMSYSEKLRYEANNPVKVPGSNFRQKPSDTLFSICSLRRNAQDEFLIRILNSAETNAQVLTHIPSKSYARLISPSTVNHFEEKNVRNADVDPAVGRVDNPIGGLNGNFLGRLIGDSFRPGIDFAPSSPATLVSDEYTTILDEVAAILRSIQRDVLSIKQKSGSEFSYLDSDGLTRYNRWDDNTMLACIFEIMRCLLVKLFPIERLLVGDRSVDGRKLRIEWNSASVVKLRNFLDVLLITYDSGAPLEEMFTPEGGINSVPDVSYNTRFVESGISAGQLVELINSLVKHRKFLKVCLGYINSITGNVAEANSKLLEHFQLKRDNGSFVDFYNSIKQNKAGSLCIEMLTRSQNSIKREHSLQRVPLPRPCHLRSDLVNNQEENDIQEFFLNTMSPTTSVDDLAFCVGLPSGLIEDLQNPRILEETGDAPSALRDRPSSLKKIVIEFNKVNELYTGDLYAPVRFVYDPELWILPGGLSFKRDALLGNTIKSILSLVEGTTYTRINNGRVVEAKTGLDLLASVDESSRNEMQNILLNHVTDKIFQNFARDVVGINLNDSSWFVDNVYGLNLVDDQTLFNLQKILLDPAVSSIAQLTSEKVGILFEDVGKKTYPGIKRLRSFRQLTSLVENGRITSSDVERIIKMLGNRNFNPFIESQRLLCPRFFDRVFTVLLSTNISNSNSTSFSRLVPRKSNMQQDSINMQGFDVSGYMCNISLKR